MTDATSPAMAGRDIIAGWILNGLAILFLLMDGAIKLVPIQPVYDTMQALGWPTDTMLLRSLGALSIISTLLYAWRRTALIGAILLTAYLGGAVATHVRIGSPLFSHILFSIYLGLFMWGGLWLRSPSLRTLLPLAKG